MIVVRIMLTIKSELQSQFAIIMRDNISKSREFEGCQTFDVFCQNKSATGYLLYQEWASLECFEAFHSSEYFKQSSGEIFQLLDGNPDAAYYQATQI